MISGKLVFQAYCPNGIYQHAENFARTQHLIGRLAKVHPLLADMCWIKGNGRKPWLKLPILRDVTLEEWVKYNEKAAIIDRDGRAVDIHIPFWNRQLERSHEFSMSGAYNDLGLYSAGNFFVVSRIPLILIEPNIMASMMLAFMESFDAYRAHYYCFYRENDGNDLKQVMYQLWLKDGEPFPETGVDFNMSAGHPAPPISEPWQGGTRYTWPNHEPRKFLGL